MVHVIEANHGGRSWISGVFENEDDANSYMKQIPIELRAYQRQISMDIRYPFYLIEKQGFDYVGLDGLIQRLDCLEYSDNDEGQVYFNVYQIKADYWSKKAGEDYMGIIWHNHVTVDFMKWYKEEGVEFLKRRGLI